MLGVRCTARDLRAEERGIGGGHELERPCVDQSAQIWLPGSNADRNIPGIGLLEVLAASLSRLDDAVAAAAPPCGAACQDSQRAALQALFAALDGPNWRDADMRRIWQSDIHHCCWPGVQCCGADGTLPVAIRTDTEIVGLADSGPIRCMRPGAVVTLNLDRVRDCSNNPAAAPVQLPGAALARLATGLETLNLAGLCIGGQLPVELADAVLLRLLDLSSNRFEGPLPESGEHKWSEHAFLTDMAIHLNGFTGSLPDSLGKGAHRLQRLVFRNNDFDVIPASLAQLPYMSVLDGTNNNVEFGVIDALNVREEDAPFLELNDIIINRGVTAKVYHLRGNRISGRLDPAIFALPIREYDLGDNRIFGTLPKTLGTLGTLRIFAADGNNLTGTLPDPLTTASIHRIHLSRNPLLTGTLPKSLRDAPFLSHFDVSKTRVFGEVPDNLGDMEDLQTFDARDTLMTHNLTRRNSRGELLPESLKFCDTFLAQSGDVDNLQMFCPDVVPARQQGALELFTVRLSPLYFRYEGCVCASGFVLRRRPLTDEQRQGFAEVSTSGESGWAPDGDVAAWDRDFMPKERFGCVPEQDEVFTTLELIVVVACSAIGLFVVCSVVLALLFWRQLQAALQDRRKRAGPPPGGRDVTLVLTDVEDSTKMWEGNPKDMAVANALHDTVLRKHLPRWYGYEVSTEGDSFLLAFHTPSDALGYCMMVQQALMTTPWPESVLARESRVRRTSVGTGEKVRGVLRSADGAPPQGAAQGEGPGALGRKQFASDLLSDGRLHSFEAAGATRAAPAPVPGLTFKPPPEAIRHGSRVVDDEGVATRDGNESPETSPGSNEQPGPPSRPQPPRREGDVYFCGLRVRMSVATAHATQTVHRMTRRFEYTGPVYDLVNAIQDVTSGGQILMCEKSYESAIPHLAETEDRIRASAVHQALFLMRRAAHSGPAPPAKLVSAAPNIGQSAAALQVGKSGLDSGRGGHGAILEASSGPSESGARSRATTVAVEDMSRLVLGPLGMPRRARAARYRSTRETSADEVDERDRSAGAIRGTAWSLSVSLAQSIRRVASFWRGDSLARSAGATHFFENGRVAANAAALESALAVLDMGVHAALGANHRPVHLFQPLVPQLEERARLFKPLPASSLVLPGYFDAPGTLETPLVSSNPCVHGVAYSACMRCKSQLEDFPLVTVAFVAPCKLDELFRESESAAKDALRLYKSAVRRLLPRFSGYECQELTGSFMLVFHCTSDALMFGWSLQLTLRDLAWPARVLRTTNAGVHANPADYFGSVVNRAARICFAAARAGEVLGPAAQIGRALAVLSRTSVGEGRFVDHNLRRHASLDLALESHGLKASSDDAKRRSNASRADAGAGTGTSQATICNVNAQLLLDVCQVDPATVEVTEGAAGADADAPDCILAGGPGERSAPRSTSRAGKHVAFPPGGADGLGNARVPDRAACDGAGALPEQASLPAGVVASGRWVSLTEAMALDHIGSFRLKGVAGEFELAALRSASRPPRSAMQADSAKAKCLGPAKGAVLEGSLRALVPVGKAGEQRGASHDHGTIRDSNTNGSVTASSVDDGRRIA
ncbi:unnamed protein product [Pedinophyceae sp. YPF-701]|nr:unnamed protein product [Pedinophyceae sp. YPF-701]